MTIFAELETLTPAQVAELAERVVEYAEEVQLRNARPRLRCWCLSPKERRRK
jgi:hypothetical protein